MLHLGLDGSTATMLWVAEIVFFFLSVFWRPAAGLYLLIPLLPLQTIRYRLHGYFLGAQFVDVLLLGVILGLRRRGEPLLGKTPLNTLLFIYIGFTYLSMIKGSFFLGIGLPLWFDDSRVSDWKNYVVDLSLMFFVVRSAIQTKRQMGILMCGMSIGVLLLAKNFHSSISGRDFSSFSYSLRDSGAMGWAGVNGLAALMAQVAVCFLGFCLAERRFRNKLAYLGVISACTYCLLFALSRGGYGAFLIGALYLGITKNRLLLVALVSFLFVWQGIVPAAVRERVMMTDNEGVIDHSAASRLSLWEEAMQVFKADPVFGTGFNTYAYGSHVGGYGDTHNVFVKVLVETGLTGIVLFLAIFRKLFQIGRRLYRTATDPFLQALGLGFSTMMLAVFVGNMFGDRWMYFEITGYTYAFAAMAVRAQEISDSEVDEQSQEENIDEIPEMQMIDAPA
jgi:putative inorganic carbon (hco3(-)) transporter